ncbi:MAG: hypothetical protein NTW86_20065 [Candidatus Sumerlaeota bacterium]|nr:hypothetical protein [Candidatus Sumerlaeota bacterium]
MGLLSTHWPRYVWDAEGVARVRGSRETVRIRWDDLLSVHTWKNQHGEWLALSSDKTRLQFAVSRRYRALRDEARRRLAAKEEALAEEKEIVFQYPTTILRSERQQCLIGLVLTVTALILISVDIWSHILVEDWFQHPIDRATLALLVVLLTLPALLAIPLAAIFIQLFRRWRMLKRASEVILTRGELVVPAPLSRKEYYLFSDIKAVAQSPWDRSTRIIFRSAAPLTFYPKLSYWDLFNRALRERLAAGGYPYEDLKLKINWVFLAARCVLYAALLYWGYRALLRWVNTP